MWWKKFHLVSLEIVGFVLVILAIYVFKDKELNHSPVRRLYTYNTYIIYRENMFEIELKLYKQ